MCDSHTVKPTNSSFNNCFNLKYVNLPFKFFAKIDSTVVEMLKATNLSQLKTFMTG